MYVYKIIPILFVIFLFINCSSKPTVPLRTANINTKEESISKFKSRSTNDYPRNAKPGRCYVKKMIPAQYRTVTEQVLVKEAYAREEEIPAVVDVVEEDVVDVKGHVYWKTSDNGDIYCLEKVPTTYKKVKKEIVKVPATRKVVEVPAEYQTITKKELEREERMEWFEILCENNATPERIARIQSALKDAGFDPVKTNGELTEDTFKALNEFQKAKNLRADNDRYIYIDTIKTLGINIHSIQSAPRKESKEGPTIKVKISKE